MLSLPWDRHLNPEGIQAVDRIVRTAGAHQRKRSKALDADSLSLIERAHTSQKPAQNIPTTAYTPQQRRMEAIGKPSIE